MTRQISSWELQAQNEIDSLSAELALYKYAVHNQNLERDGETIAGELLRLQKKVARLQENYDEAVARVAILVSHLREDDYTDGCRLCGCDITRTYPARARALLDIVEAAEKVALHSWTIPAALRTGYAKELTEALARWKGEPDA